MEIGEFLSRWCVWLLSVSFPICEKTLTWILMFHLYQRCFSKLAVLVFYSADKKKKKWPSVPNGCVGLDVLFGCCLSGEKQTHTICLSKQFWHNWKTLQKIQTTFCQRFSRHEHKFMPRWYLVYEDEDEEKENLFMWLFVEQWLLMGVNWFTETDLIWNFRMLTATPAATSLQKVTWMLFRCLCRKKNIRIRKFYWNWKKFKKQNCFFGHVCLGGNKVFELWNLSETNQYKNKNSLWSVNNSFDF